MYMYASIPVSGLWKSMTDKKLGMRSECNHILNAAEQIDVFSIVI